VVTAHGRALWRLVGTQLHAALPRALRKAPVLDKIRHLILLPPMDGMVGIRRMCTPARSPVPPVPLPKRPAGEAAELEWDWEDHVRECLKALHRRQHVRLQWCRVAVANSLHSCRVCRVCRVCIVLPGNMLGVCEANRSARHGD
jgi:hypothetical protein